MAQSDVKKKFSTLSKLEISKKVPKKDRKETKSIQAMIKKYSEQEHVIDLKKLFVPDHFLCMISGEIMNEPVTIESGRSFEKANIEHYF